MLAGMARHGEGGLRGSFGLMQRQVNDDRVRFAVVQKPNRGRLGSAGRAANFDLISSRAKTKDQREAGPIGGNRGSDGKTVAAKMKAEHFLDPDAIHPGGGAGVPGPA